MFSIIIIYLKNNISIRLKLIIIELKNKQMFNPNFNLKIFLNINI